MNKFMLVMIMAMMSPLMYAQGLELKPDTLKDFPVQRGARFPVVSSTIYLEALKKVYLNPAEIKLTPDREKFRSEYEKHLYQTAHVAANMIGDPRYSTDIDDALFYAYTFQVPVAGKPGKYTVNERFVQKVQAQKYFPSVIQFSFWPWTSDGVKVNGLYYPGALSEGGILQLSLYDNFMQDAVLKAVKNQDPAYKFNDSYADALGAMGKDLAAKMPIIQVFIHENNHCVLEDGGNGLSSDRGLAEGMTELLTHRAVHRLAGGYEDFNDVFSYPSGVLMAALLWGLDPESLMDWYANSSGKSMDNAYSEALAKAMENIKDVNNSGRVLLKPANREKFKTAFKTMFLEEKAKSLDDLRSVFRDNVDMKLFYDHFMGDNGGIFFRQLPMKIRLFVLENFFWGISPEMIGLNKNTFEQKVKDLRVKVPNRKNWNRPEDKEVSLLIADAAGAEGTMTPISMTPIKPDQKPDPKGNLNDLKTDSPVVLDAPGGVPEGPESGKWVGKKVKIPTPGPAVDTGASFPPVKEWFAQRWKNDPNAKPKGDSVYAPLRDDLIGSFEISKVFKITGMLIEKNGISEKIRQEWVDFLNGYMAKNLEQGADQLKVPDMEGLFPTATD